jgi:hypothetical protein
LKSPRKEKSLYKLLEYSLKSVKKSKYITGNYQNISLVRENITLTGKYEKCRVAEITRKQYASFCLKMVILVLECFTF